MADRPPAEALAVEVVTLGECLIALVAGDVGPLTETTRFERHVAGAEANVAVGLARLGHRVGYIGRVGDDGFGTTIVRRLRGEGIAVDWLRPEPGATTGLLVRERRALGPAEVLYYRSGSAGSCLAPSDVEAAAGAFEAARWLHVTGITPALSESAARAVDAAIELARATHLTVSLDLNVRRKLWTATAAVPALRALASRSDVVLGSQDEMALVGGRDVAEDSAELAAAVLDLGPSVAVLKLGSAGAVALERGGSPITAGAMAVAAVDTIGAGDAFSAGFIAARLEGADLHRALVIANACGAAAVAAVGDLTGLPDRRELDRLLDASAGGDTIR